jgi:hypothetical protein
MQIAAALNEQYLVRNGRSWPVVNLTVKISISLERMNLILQ